MDAIRVVDVGKDFGTLRVLEGISCQIIQGEAVAFVGPSGCGKSTLLSLLAQLIAPTRGVVTSSFSRQAFSFVFQEASLMPWRTVFGNIALGLELLDMPAVHRDPIVRHYLQRFGLDTVQHFYPHQLSGGLKMRVSLARALAVNPRVLLLDEPFAALDFFLRETYVDEILELCRRDQMTSILVTHSIPEAVYLAQRVYVLSQKPARVVGVVDLSQELHQSKTPAFKETPLFQSFCQQIRDLLRQVS